MPGFPRSGHIYRCIYGAAHRVEKSKYRLYPVETEPSDIIIRIYTQHTVNKTMTTELHSIVTLSTIALTAGEYRTVPSSSSTSERACMYKQDTHS